jgi:hypothetical protein
MSSVDPYFINNKYISSSHTKTQLSPFGNLVSINKPVYHIPLHILSAIYICAWRDNSSSCLDLAIRRIACSIALGALAGIGVVDAVVRIALAIFTFATQHSTTTPKAFLSGAAMGLQQSVYFASGLQIRNLFEEWLLRYFI